MDLAAHADPYEQGLTLTQNHKINLPKSEKQ